MPNRSLTQPDYSLYQLPIILISMISTNQSKLSNIQTLASMTISSPLRKMIIKQQVKMTNTSGTKSRSSLNRRSTMSRCLLCSKRKLIVMISLAAMNVTMTIKKIVSRGFWPKQLSHHRWSCKHQVAPIYLTKLCLRRLKTMRGSRKICS